MEIGLGHYLSVAAILFAIGMAGIFLNRKNVIVILMSVELMLLSVNINFVAFSQFIGDLTGQVFAFMVLTVAAAEAAVGLAILVAYFRNRGDISVDDAKPDEELSPVMSLEPFVVLLPLFGALLAMPISRIAGAGAAQMTTSSLMGLAALYAWILFFDVALGGQARTIVLFNWITSGDFVADWAVRLDTLSAVMLVVVNTVSFLVHVYSMGYMKEYGEQPRFFAYLSLFTFAMLMLVTADNFLQLFFGWEGVGLASYLLIGFWFDKKSANDAAIKAFIVNRVGDFGFALGIFCVFYVFGTVEFDAVFAAIAQNAVTTPFGAAAGAPIRELTIEFLGNEFHALTTMAILLFIGAMGKSAQFLLHTWLPDAMEGPTPVSALIHAATMVTAGVFLVCRCSIIFEYAPNAAALVTLVGAVTAFFAATVGLLQDDIKKVIAYSTCSQLGYMFFAAGVGAYGAAMFHSVHARFLQGASFPRFGRGDHRHAP